MLLDGKEVSSPGPERAVVFQNHSLLPWLTCFDNVYLAVERVFAQQNRATVMGTAQASGVALLLAAAERGAVGLGVDIDPVLVELGAGLVWLAVPAYGDAGAAAIRASAAVRSNRPASNSVPGTGRGRTRAAIIRRVPPPKTSWACPRMGSRWRTMAGWSSSAGIGMERAACAR